MAEDDFDAAWERVNDPSSASGEPTLSDEEAEAIAAAGPPIRVTLLVRADKVPVAPWAQGWRVAAAGPVDGHVTLLFEQDMSDSPVAQLAAVTGLFGIVKQARLDVVWWAIGLRAPFPHEQQDDARDLDEQLGDLLGGGGEG